MAKKGKDSDGSPEWWDASWAPRTVEFKVTVVATFHPSVETASIRLNWLDASGNIAPAPVIIGPLSTFQVDEGSKSPSRRWPGAVTASMEKTLGNMAVTRDFIRGLQKSALPVHVLLGGADPEARAGGAAHLHPGPLLLASEAQEPQVPLDHLEPEAQEIERERLFEENKRKAEEARKVVASGIETIGLVGLHRLEIKLSTETPVLSREMLERIIPVCFTIDAVKGLPNEPWLASKCEDVYAEVYPDSGTSNTLRMAQECPRVRLSSRPHNTIVKFSEPIVWLLGCLHVHSIREWLLNEELVVEVHDRDLRPEEVAIDDHLDEEARRKLYEEDKYLPFQMNGETVLVRSGDGYLVDHDQKSMGRSSVISSQKSIPRGLNLLWSKKVDDTSSHIVSWGTIVHGVEEQSDDGAKWLKVEIKDIVHPHGVARFKLAPLLGVTSLAVALRSEVFPTRGNKKQRRAQLGLTGAEKYPVKVPASKNVGDEALFDGDWIRQGKRMASISGTSLIRASGGNETISLEAGKKKFSMRCKGQNFWAELQDDGKLCWSDGDIWQRQLQVAFTGPDGRERKVKVPEGVKEGETFYATVSLTEAAPDYLTKGCVCTIRASMAVPIAKARKIQDGEEMKDQEEWCASEQRQGDSNIWAVPSPAKTDTSKQKDKAHEETESQSSVSAPVVAPTLRCRAKVSAHGEQISGPWRTSKEEAEEDDRQLQAILEECVDADVDTIKAAAMSLKQKPSHGLDRRYERYGRAVVVLDDKDSMAAKNILKFIREVNAEVLRLDHQSDDFHKRELHEEEKANPHLDALTGFCILDGQSRIIVVEGLRERGMQRLIETADRNARRNGNGYKLLCNPDVGFSERLYGDFGPRLKHLKLKVPLDEVGQQPSYRKDVLNGLTVLPKLLAIKGMERFRPLRQGAAFPKASDLVELEENSQYCEPVPVAMLEGEPAPQKDNRKSIASRVSLQGGASFSFSAPSFEEEARRNGRTTLPARTLDHSKSKHVNPDGATLLPEDASKPISSQVLRDLALSLPDPPPQRTLLDTKNHVYENVLTLRTSSSLPDFRRKNKESVGLASAENTQKNVALNRRQPRPCPFMDGKEVHMYSGQKLNCTERQKEWLREKYVKQEQKVFFSYDETHMSNNFDLSAEGAESGLRRHHPRCPTDTYARLPDDDRPVWRNPPPRPKEEFRKPARDIGPARGDELHEAFVDGEWFKLPIGDERHKPIRVDVRFEPSKVPHHRQIKEQPFDKSKVCVKGKDFGPKSMYESVHYNSHGAPGDDRMADVAGHNALLRDEAASKIIGNRYMRTFSEGNTRKGITCIDREERLLKDEPTMVLRGSGLDDPLPTSIRIFEPYHGFGNPSVEFQARLRENDNSAPFDVSTGGYIKRDPDVGLKKSIQSGTLGKAPWQHDNTILQKTRPKPQNQPKHFTYVSSKNFNHSSMLANPTHTESHVWKNATRSAISQSEKSLHPYRRPVDYGVSLQAS